MDIEEILKAKYGVSMSYIKPSTLNPRSLYLKDMIEIVNEERKGTKIPLIVSNWQKTRFAVTFSHIPTDDLPYVISVGKDYKARGGQFGKYLFGSIKIKK